MPYSEGTAFLFAVARNTIYSSSVCQVARSRLKSYAIPFARSISIVVEIAIYFRLFVLALYMISGPLRKLVLCLDLGVESGVESGKECGSPSVRDLLRRLQVTDTPRLGRFEDSFVTSWSICSGWMLEDRRWN